MRIPNRMYSFWLRSRRNLDRTRSSGPAHRGRAAHVGAAAKGRSGAFLVDGLNHTARTDLDVGFGPFHRSPNAFGFFVDSPFGAKVCDRGVSVQVSLER